MLMISLLKNVFSYIQTTAAEKAAYRELSRLDPYLLEDMGIRLQQGKVISLREEEAPKRVEPLILVVDSGQVRDYSGKPPPQLSNG